MRILVNFPVKLSADDTAALRACAPHVEVIEQFETEAEKLNGTGVEVLVSEWMPRDLSTWGSLRWLQLISAGANQMRGHPLLPRSVAITNASGCHGVPIAQYITCTALMMAHRMPQLLEFKPTRTWPNRSAPQLACSSLRGRTAGILGYGSIGRESARQLAALGMRIICYKRDPKVRTDDGFTAWPGTGDPRGELPAAWYGPGQLEEMLPQCDLVVVTVPSTPSTESLIGVHEFAAMKPSAHLVHVSRGGVVDESALSDALRTGRLAAAAVDCFVGEPVRPDNPLFAVPRLIMTPHMSGVHDAFWPMFNVLVRENLVRLLAGRPLLNEINRTECY